MQSEADSAYLGIDLGTSSCCIVAIDGSGQLLTTVSARIPIPARQDNQVTQDPNLWWKAVTACLRRLFKEVPPQQVRAIAVDGTSGSVLLCDRKGTPLLPAIMYNDNRAVSQAEKILNVAERDSGAHGASSSLAKLLWLHDQRIDAKAAHFLHQADWITGKLTGLWGVSDYNNCLKLGYDAANMAWPHWLEPLGINSALLPAVHTPGEPLGPVNSEVAKTFALPPDTQVVAGTTDGVAAFLAAGASQPGEAVTALGSTLVLKVLSDKPVFSPEHGVYSHRLGPYWLVGGASNSGGAVLLQYFKVDQIREMTPLLNPESFTGLEYYPLAGMGERFPVNNPKMTASLTPLPGDSVTFLQGMLEGIARIEARGYQLLTKLGAPRPTSVRTTGGGSQNPAWKRIRERIVGVEIKKARSELAAYGAALLAAGLLEQTLASR
jgi:sugar (pentulose or hexulose) kinase